MKMSVRPDEKKISHTVIQPFVDEVFEFTDEWVELCEKLDSLNIKPKNLVVQQVESAFENIRGDLCSIVFCKNELS